MKIVFRVAVLLLSCALPLAASAAATDRIIVSFKDPQARVQVLAGGEPLPQRGRAVAALSERAGHAIAWQRAMSGGADVLRLPSFLPLGEVGAIAARIAELPEVEYAEPDRRVFPALVPNDPHYGEQWHFHAVVTAPPPAVNYGINLPDAWEITTGDATVVAVIDTGILFDHVDLSGKAHPGYDFIDDAWVANDGDGRDPDPSDPGDWVTVEEKNAGLCDEAYDSTWHGSHVAGTIAAATDNHIGVAGVSWGAMILPLRALGKCGGYTSDIADAIRWAAGLSVGGVPNNPFPARIINLSLGAAGPCAITEQNAIDAANGAGALIVAAAGNGGSNLSTSPASPAVCNGVVTVAAMDRAGNRAGYSNYGAAVDIAAPGGDSQNTVLSTADGGATAPVNDSAYAAYAGTSMATAHVSGIIALTLSHNPGLSRGEIIDLITGNVTAFPGGSTCNTAICGAGIANAHAAVNAAGGIADTTPEAFAFAAQAGVALDTVVTSNTIAITGIDALAPVSVSGGEYSLGCDAGAFTAEPGEIGPEGTICVRHVSSSEYNGTVTTTLTIGGVEGGFTSTTRSAPSSRGGGGGAFQPWWLLPLVYPFRRRRAKNAPQSSPPSAP